LNRLKLSNTSGVIALSSAVAFGTQVAFALLMLQLFTPQEVGEFSVISQISFFCMTLALAQAPLSLLANYALPAHLAAQQALQASVLRYIGLIPLAGIGLWLSQLNVWPTLIWVSMLALSQIGWMLAQSLTLRTGSHWQQAGVRVLPPATAALTAAVFSLSGGIEVTTGRALILSALLGYAIGAIWLAPALLARSEVQPVDLTTKPAASDTRSTKLRLAHTAVDASLATAIVVVWQRLYGAEDTGWMTALLRVLGFLPALVHMAWAQVAMVQKHPTHPRSPWQLGLVAFGGVIVLGLSFAGALHLAWLDPHWQGASNYIAPLVLWQGCACISAAFSHRPFQTQSAQVYSWGCIGVSLAQCTVLLAPMWLSTPIEATQHIIAFGLISSIGLLGLATWMARLR
jgi:uncharacterized membrane protein YqaE (UPF0057 family)